jgi:hypothetical protein
MIRRRTCGFSYVDVATVIKLETYGIMSAEDKERKKDRRA